MADAASPTAGTILVVDDNEANRYAVAYWLREAGFGVIEAESGEEALRKAELHPDLVTVPQVLELGCLALGQADPGGGAVVAEQGHGIGLVQAEASTQLGHGDERARGDEAAQA